MMAIEKRHAVGIVFILVAIVGLMDVTPAKADAYFGISGGVGIGSGTELPLDAGFSEGATAGYQLSPDFGVAVNYLHSTLGITGTDSKESINQIMAEANLFSYLILHGGVHVGDVITNTSGVASKDLGFGVHVGFDYHVSPRLSVGLTGYGTYVTEKADKHSLINLMIPFKVWF